MPKKKNSGKNLRVVDCYDVFTAVSSRLELLSVLLISEGSNLPPIFSSRDDWECEVHSLVSDELSRLSVYLRNLGTQEVSSDG